MTPIHLLFDLIWRQRLEISPENNPAKIDFDISTQNEEGIKINDFFINHIIFSLSHTDFTFQPNETPNFA